MQFAAAPNQAIAADGWGLPMMDTAVRGTVEDEARVFENCDIRAMARSVDPTAEPADGRRR